MVTSVTQATNRQNERTEITVLKHRKNIRLNHLILLRFTRVHAYISYFQINKIYTSKHGLFTEFRHFVEKYGEKLKLW